MAQVLGLRNLTLNFSNYAYKLHQLSHISLPLCPSISLRKKKKKKMDIVPASYKSGED